MSADLTKLLKLPKDEEMSRPQIVKHLLAYLKEHNLQDLENKQWFTPDKAMEPIFGKEKIKAFGMTKYLKGHVEWFEMMTPVLWLYLIWFVLQNPFEDE